MDNNMNNMGQPVMQQPANSGAGIDVNKIINDLKNDKKSLIAIGGAILTIIACFIKIITVKVTFISSTSSSWSLSNIAKGNKAFFEGSDYSALILILLAIATIVLVVLKKHVYTAATAGLSLLTLIIEVIRIKHNYNDQIEKLGKNYSKYFSLKWNAGLFVLIIGIVAVGVSVYLLWKENPNCFKDAIAKIKGMFGGNKAQVAQPVAQAPVQPTYQAPVQPVSTTEPTENINNDINNNVM